MIGGKRLTTTFRYPIKLVQLCNRGYLYQGARGRGGCALFLDQLLVGWNFSVLVAFLEQFYGTSIVNRFKSSKTAALLKVAFMGAVPGSKISTSNSPTPLFSFGLRFFLPWPSHKDGNVCLRQSILEKNEFSAPCDFAFWTEVPWNFIGPAFELHQGLSIRYEDDSTI